MRGPDGTSGTLNLRTFDPSDRRKDEEMIVTSQCYVLIRIFQAFSIYTGPRSGFSDSVVRFRIVKAPC
jgi:hypothetical protein